MRLSLSAILALLFIGALSAPVKAQSTPQEKFTLVYKDVALDDALEQLVTSTKINLLFDPDLIAGISISCTAKKMVPEKILQCIIKEADLDYYRLSSGTYVIIEKPEEPPQFGNLAGIVVDKQTGEPLPYANVLLADASTGTATNTAGMFTFSSLMTGPHAIVTTYVGYEASLDSVWIESDSQSKRRIELAPSPIVADPIVVNGLTQRLPSYDLGTGSKEFGNLAPPASLGGDDAVYSVSSILNVGVRPPFIDLHIQGGEAGEHQILLDGVPVFEPVSLGRLMGAFSPLAIGRITVHKAGFGASIGSQLSGLLNIEQDLNSSKYGNFTAQIDPLSVNGRVNFKMDLPGSASGEFMVAGRTSYWDIYQYGTLNNLLQEWNNVDPLLSETAFPSLNSDQALFLPHQHGSDVSFSDLHAATSISINPFHNIFASVYHGTNEVGSDLLTSEEANVTEGAYILLTQDNYKWTNTTGQIRYNWLIGARALGMVRVRNSLHTLSHIYLFEDSQSIALPENPTIEQIEQSLSTAISQKDIPDDENRVRETAIEGTLDYSLTANSHLQTGLELTQINNEFRLSSPFFIPFLLDFSGWRASGFVQNTYSIGLQGVLETGLRLTYVPDRKSVYAEPRVSYRYDTKATSAGLFSFHVAAGLYRQFTNPFNLSNAGPSAAVPSIRFWIPIDETVSPSRSYHLAGNVLWSPREDMQIRLETFYKDQPRILALDYETILTDASLAGETLQGEDITEPAKGYAYGAGIYVEKTYEKGVGSVQYSYSVAKRRYPDRFKDNRLQTTPWNEPHRLTLAQDFFLSSSWTAQIRANGIWGRSWGFRQTYYDYLAAHNTPSAYPPFALDNPGSDTLPPIYQLDAGISYKKTLKNVDVLVRADLLNVLDHDNVVDWSLQSVSGSFEKVDRIMPGLTTALSLRVKF